MEVVLGGQGPVVEVVAVVPAVPDNELPVGVEPVRGEFGGDPELESLRLRGRPVGQEIGVEGRRLGLVNDHDSTNEGIEMDVC